MSSKWRQTLEDWLKTIDVSGSVLDVGGKQKPVEGRTKSWDVSDYRVLDLPDFDLGEFSGGEYDMYDSVFCLETVMYTTDPVSAITNLVGMTGENLYISNPLEAYGETKPEGTDMHRLFPNWWRLWLNELGMEIKELHTVNPVNPQTFAHAQRENGYKMIRPHQSGILIHAIKK